jgi:hypothetical protein
MLTPGTAGDGVGEAVRVAGRRALLLASSHRAAVPTAAADRFHSPLAALTLQRPPLRDLRNVPVTTGQSFLQLPPELQAALSENGANIPHSWCFVPLIRDIVGLPIPAHYYPEVLRALIGVDLWDSWLQAHRAHLQRTNPLSVARQRVLKLYSITGYISPEDQEKLLRRCDQGAYQDLAYRIGNLRHEWRVSCENYHQQSHSSAASAATAAAIAAVGNSSRRPAFPPVLDYDMEVEEDF